MIPSGVDLYAAIDVERWVRTSTEESLRGAVLVELRNEWKGQDAPLLDHGIGKPVDLLVERGDVSLDVASLHTTSALASPRAQTRSPAS